MMHPVACALFHGSGLAHENGHPKKMPGYSVDTDDSPRRSDYADDIGLLTSKHHDAQHKAEHLSKTVSTISLKVNTKKSQVQKKNTRFNDPVMIDRKHIEDDEELGITATKKSTPVSVKTTKFSPR